MRAKAPTIHSNGTALTTLLTDIGTALETGRAFRHALAATMPNGRDFYPQGGDAMLVAMHEHNKRVRDVDACLRELMDIAEQIVDQKPDTGIRGAV